MQPMSTPSDFRDLSYYDGGLSPSEKFWAKYYAWFRDQGYQLRGRFSPEWIPSWISTKNRYTDCEDGQMLINGVIVDAVDTENNNASVALKVTSKLDNPLEEENIRYLTSEPLLSDPHNHCVPLLRVLQPPKDPNDVILVMPMLLKFYLPPFDTFGEAVDCIQQLFEGLYFMHKHHVAHRDINLNNFMMQERGMFSNGYHPVRTDRSVDLRGRARFLTRTQCPPRYFIIDFGISGQYTTDNDKAVDSIVIGGDKTVPEFQAGRGELYNPFPADVYCAGNLVRYCFLEGHPLFEHIPGYKGFEFLRPLVYDMIQEDPAKRPTMDEVLRRFEFIVSGLSSWKLRSRTVPRRENLIFGIVYGISHWMRRTSFIIKGTPAIPRVVA